MSSIVSSATATLLSWTSAARLQADLLQAQQELSSGRRDDVGLSLGAGIIRDTSLRNQLATGAAFIASNSLLTARFTAATDALASLTKVAEGLQQTLISTKAGSGDVSTIVQQGKTALSQVIATTNTSFDGAYLFGAPGAGGRPLNDFSPGSGTGSSAVLASAFAARFGVEPGDAAASTISSADMQSFLTQEFDGLFDSGDWGALWSNESGGSGGIRVSDTLSIEDAASSGSPAIRDLVKSAVMVAGLGLESLSADAREVVLSQATATLGRALMEIATLSAHVGLSSATIQNATDQLQAQQTQLKIRLSDMEAVDPTEVSTRLSALSTQLQASYQTTARLAKLSLVNFI